MHNPTVASNTTTQNKVLSQTYQFLSITLLWSAFVAFISMATNFTQTITQAGGFYVLIFLALYFVNLFLIEKNKDNGLGVFFTFTLTGLLGLTLSPMVHYAFSTGNTESVLLALAGTGIAFLGAGSYGRTTNRNLSGMIKYLVIGLIAAFVMSLINVFFIQASIFSMLLSGVFIVLSTMLIAWQMQAIIKGGETNYISATVTLFVAIYNIFSSLLHILLGMNE